MSTSWVPAFINFLCSSCCVTVVVPSLSLSTFSRASLYIRHPLPKVLPDLHSQCISLSSQQRSSSPSSAPRQPLTPSRPPPPQPVPPNQSSKHVLPAQKPSPPHVFQQTTTASAKNGLMSTPALASVLTTLAPPPSSLNKKPTVTTKPSTELPPALLFPALCPRLSLLRLRDLPQEVQSRLPVLVVRLESRAALELQARLLLLELRRVVLREIWLLVRGVW